jgi:hypothetical protein
MVGRFATLQVRNLGVDVDVDVDAPVKMIEEAQVELALLRRSLARRLPRANERQLRVLRR